MEQKNETSQNGVRHVDIVLGNGFPLAAKKINPNQPCECGSGKKAKKCCGTETKYCYSKLNEKQLEEKKRKEEQIIQSNKV
jgi:hypothetical protein